MHAEPVALALPLHCTVLLCHCNICCTTDNDIKKIWNLRGLALSVTGGRESLGMKLVGKHLCGLVSRPLALQYWLGFDFLQGGNGIGDEVSGCATGCGSSTRTAASMLAFFRVNSTEYCTVWWWWWWKVGMHRTLATWVGAFYTALVDLGVVIKFWYIIDDSLQVSLSVNCRHVVLL